MPARSAQPAEAPPRRGARPAVRPGDNLPGLRARNVSVVLDAVRRLGPISRTGVAGATGLTPAAMTNLVAELAERGLVLETKAESRSVGRRPSLLRFNPEAGLAVGLELSRTGARGLLTDLAGRVQTRVERAYPRGLGVQSVAGTAEAIVKEILATGAHPAGVGIGVPGPVDSTRGIVLRPPNFGGWADVRLAERLSGRLGLPVWLDDDAKTAALGERWFGAGQGEASLLYVSIGQGIGAGLVVAETLYRGTHELAGEIGHTTLDLDGPECECGNRGCLETLVSIPAIERHARQAGLGACDVASVDDLAARGDPTALAVRERALRYLSAAVLNAVNHYDPALIVLGGPLVTLWPDLCPQIIARVRGRSFGFASGSVRIVPARLGADSSALGAASLAIEATVRSPSLLRAAAT